MPQWRAFRSVGRAGQVRTQYAAPSRFHHWRLGILGRPVKPGDDGGRFGALASDPFRHAPSRSRGAMRPSFAFGFAPKEIRGRREDRVRAAPAVPCAIAQESAHTSIQVQRRTPGLPCAMALRLISRSPRRRIPVCHRRLRIKSCLSPVGPTRLHRLGISNGCRNHTVLPYAATRLRQKASPG